MSAYMEFRAIQFLNPALLAGALDALGIKYQMGPNLAKIGGRQVQILVSREALGTLYTWGFAWDGQSFNLVVNDYDAGRGLNQEFRDRLAAAYSKAAIAKLLLGRQANILQARTEGGYVQIKAEVQI
jgi:hypothetical protein